MFNKACFPDRYRRGRDCCGSAEALEKDLWVVKVRGFAKQFEASLTVGRMRPRYEYRNNRRLIALEVSLRCGPL